jgi:hypothetical protein
MNKISEMVMAKGYPEGEVSSPTLFDCGRKNDWYARSTQEYIIACGG